MAIAALPKGESLDIDLRFQVRLPEFLCILYYMSLRLLVAALSVMAASFELPAADQPKVVWLSDLKEWEGWKDDIAELKAARKHQPLSGYLFSQEVEWAGQQAELKDGRSLDIVGGDMINREEIDAWKPGKKLHLCYDEIRGATLLDAGSRRWIRVRKVYGKDHEIIHPISYYLESLNAYKTYEEMSALYEATRLVRVEIDRCVKEVLALNFFPADERQNFVRLTKARADYCEMQSSFGAGAIYASWAGGSARGPLLMHYRYGIYRQALIDLLALADDYVAFERPIPAEGK
jgi:hypothetical protein